jgi:hypothetical protein
MLKHIKSVLDFSAFRPEPDDPAFSWKARFSGRKTALINVGRNFLAFTVVDAKGGRAGEGSAQGELKEIFSQMGPQIVDETDDGWCCISLDTRYVISLETNLSRKKGSEEAAKTDPRSVLHARYEKGKRYAITHNPESNSSLLLSYDEEFLKKVEGFCKEQKIRLGRLCCGAYVLLRYALSETNVKKGSEAPLSKLYIVCCSGSVCILSQTKDTWVELRSRPDVYESSIDPLMEFIAPYRERIASDAGLVLACDNPIQGLPEKLGELFPGRPLDDLTKEGLLLSLLFLN